MQMNRLKSGKFKSVPGEFYGTPKEVYGFRTKSTPASAEKVAQSFLLANSELFELEPNLAGLQIRRIIRSIGSTHIIFNQVHDGLRIHRAYVTVHVDRSGRVFLSKNRAIPARLLPDQFVSAVSKEQAIAKARRSMPKRGGPGRLRETEKLWYPSRKKLEPAWKFRITRDAPKQEWIIYVNARTGGILSRYDNLATAGTGLGLVFDPSPVTALGSHVTLLKSSNAVRRPPDEAYRQVKLPELDGKGFLSGTHVSTSPTGKRRVQSKNLQFLLRSHQKGFEEVMVYYHVDASLRYLEQLGYRGPRAIFTEPVRVNVNGTREDNSWFSPWDKVLTFGTGDIDDAEDAETILHELGHAIQDAICPDFGQSDEAAAMGEGFGDYWAASFFESRKPAKYRNSVMSWDGLLLGLKSKADPPCLRRLDGKKTFDDFDEDGDEHDNGEIWSAALWDVRKVLGQAAADRVIVESHFQLDGFTTMARGARAILDADQNLEKGKHVKTLKQIFKRRKIGPL
jgi:Zn-dependent metalloprotease